MQWKVVKYSKLVEARLFSVACGASWSQELQKTNDNPLVEVGLSPLAQRWQEKPNVLPEAEYSLSELLRDASSLKYAYLAHYYIVHESRSNNRFLGSLIIQTYLGWEALDDAFAWFSHMHDRNVYSWTFLITKYAQLGYGQDAHLSYNQMLHEAVLPDEHVFTSLVSASGCMLDLLHGTQLHAQIIGCCDDSIVAVGNAVINMYGKCGALEEAHSAFDRMPSKNVITWTAIIAAYTYHGPHTMAFVMFEQMLLEEVLPNRVTFLTLIDACNSLEQAKHVHKFVLYGGLDNDVLLATALVTMYGKCSSPLYALSTFKSMQERTVISWNALISVCAEHRLINEAVHTFHGLLDAGFVPDKISYINIVNALASQAEFSQSKQMHHLIVQEGYDLAVDVATALVHMYGSCTSIEDARAVFDRMLDRTSVSWNYMIRAYSPYGKTAPAYQLFDQMKQEDVLSDKFVFSSAISACASDSAAKEGTWLHAFVTGTGFELDIVVATALVNMYCKNGSLQHARTLFDSMMTRDQVSWNAMLDGYAQYGHILDILDFSYLMAQNGIVPDIASYVSVLSACANLVELIEGQKFHTCTVFRGFEMDTAVATAIFNMYAKCGSIQEARQMFDKVPEPNSLSWSAMIAAYAQHGHGKDALALFDKMLEGGFWPNEVTFVSVLAACSRAGLLDEGRKWWFSMQCDYGIQPVADHCDSMIDLYSRVGRLEEAEGFVKHMPVEATAISWMTLLSASRMKADVQLGAHAAQQIFDLGDQDVLLFPLLSSLYQAAEREENGTLVTE